MTKLIKTKPGISLVVTIIATVCVFVFMSSCALWPKKQIQGLKINPIACGLGHACFLGKNGGVKCGGYNHDGQLGDGTQNLRHKAMQVKGLPSGVKSISAGRAHTCVVTSIGEVKCWGRNNYGQLGDGTTTNRFTPGDVLGLKENIAAVSTDIDHTCALTTEGKVKCWGWNKSGQLGDGTTIDRTTPVDVKGLENDEVIQVSAGGGHTCVLTSNREVKCWGRNVNGQLGDGSTKQSFTPVNVKNLKKDIKAIEAGGLHTCALTFSGRVKCWGTTFSEKDKGRFVDGLGWRYKTTPTGVAGFKRGVVAISVSSGLCAIMVGGTVKCVGDIHRRIGVEWRSKNYFKRPTTVKGIPDPVIALDTYGIQSCALTKKGDFYCWGASYVARTRVKDWKNEAGKVLF